MSYNVVFGLLYKFNLLIHESPFMMSQIISLSFVPLNVKNVKRREKINKNLNILRTKRVF